MESKTEPIVLAVDLDEVSFRYIRAMREYMITKGLTPPAEDPTIFAMNENGWFETIESFKKMHGEAVEEGLYRKLEMLEEASEVLHELIESGYEVNILTSRFVNPDQNEIVVRDTAASLHNNAIPYTGLSFLSNKTRFMADAYLEDAPHNLIPLQNADRYTVTFDMSYNQDIPGDRAKTWREAREVLRVKFGR
jgi:5'(3')-deoxyribonucleotidase